MTPQPRPFADLRSGSLALFCLLTWFLAALSARFVGVWIGIGGAALGLGGFLLWKDSPTRRALLQPSSKLILQGIVAGIVMAAVTYLLYPILSVMLPFVARDTRRLYEVFRAPSAGVAVFALLPVILGEELVFRGVVQSSLSLRVGAWGGVVLASVAYALVHAPLGFPALVLAAFCCGLAWGALRLVTGSLLPAVIAHVLWDLLVLLFVPLDTGPLSVALTGLG